MIVQRLLSSLKSKGIAIDISDPGPELLGIETKCCGVAPPCVILGLIGNRPIMSFQDDDVFKPAEAGYLFPSMCLAIKSQKQLHESTSVAKVLQLW